MGLLHRPSPLEFCKIFQNSFSLEHLQTTFKPIQTVTKLAVLDNSGILDYSNDNFNN